MNIAENLARINDEIRRAEAQYQRPVNSVGLIAVSKKKPASDIEAAAAAGQRDFGENYCQEAIDKIQEISNPGLTWHFIGPIQSNKTRLIAEHFDWVHTVDRSKIARRLHEARPTDKPPLNICIQINISGEPSKSGIHPEQAADFLRAMQDFDRLRVRGLMALPAPAADMEQQRQPFARVQECLEQLRQIDPGLDTLSMGTTQDMQAAIAEGATLVRIGTAIFGERDASEGAC